jgi:hypothetical protein
MLNSAPGRWSEMSSLFKLFNLGVAGAALYLLFVGGWH